MLFKVFDVQSGKPHRYSRKLWGPVQCLEMCASNKGRLFQNVIASVICFKIFFSKTSKLEKEKVDFGFSRCPQGRFASSLSESVALCKGLSESSIGAIWGRSFRWLNRRMTADVGEPVYSKSARKKR